MSKEIITQYIAEVNQIFKAGNATEHTYRPALKSLLENITSPNLSKGGEFDKGACHLVITNEPKRIACGAPDYIVTRKDIPVGYIEAKDIGINLDHKSHKEQFDRYKQSLDNLIITDYLRFQLFEGENLITETTIGKVLQDKIVPIPENFNAFVEMITIFSRYDGKAIKDSHKLAEYMAAKTQLLAEVIEKTIADKDENNYLYLQLGEFKEALLPTMTHTQFADIYAQTIAYGMFVARLNNFTPNTSAPLSVQDEETPSPFGRAGEGLFTRQNATALIPKSNPFLRNFFQYIAGFDLDENLRWLVDSLADMFNFVDIEAIRREFSSKDKDPFLHFYEDFLTKYDKNLKTAMGAYYTPLAVVKFIVNAVDSILKTDFNIPNGLADNSKVVPTASLPLKKSNGKDAVDTQDIHRVQILDPATGTGTFLAEVVRKIYQKFENNASMWNDYVQQHLIPRLNGFEIMMSPYTMAHLKLEMILQELVQTGCATSSPQQTGHVPSLQQTRHATSLQNTDRLHIYLTNALEDPKKIIEQIGFVEWLTKEAEEASEIKNNVPVMVVLGNPPYSISSQNKSRWILERISDYKKDLNEQKLNLDDDYIKFIRFGQYFIDKTGEGILAYISNNSFIDGVTHRQMRKSLLESFDKIYILDLHGNTKKKETAPDGSKDENVFNIMQGVSINIFVKTTIGSGFQPAATVFHYDLYGKRTEKYSFLLENNLQTVPWQEIEYKEPYFFFVPKNFSLWEEYEKGFKIDELFTIYNSGVKTDRDSLFIDDDRKSLENKIKILLSEKFNNEFRQKFRVEDSSSYKLTKLIKRKQFNDSSIQQVEYRPFDRKWIYYFPELISRPADKVMKHFIKGENIGLVCERIVPNKNTAYNDIFITNTITDGHSIGSNTYIFPLYLYEGRFGNVEKKVNLNEKIVGEIGRRVAMGHAPLPEFADEPNVETQLIASLQNNDTRADVGTDKGACPLVKITPMDILDYIYAVLHSPTYREKYKEFLKIDFPRVPYPENAEQFWKLAALGGRLRRLHLLEDVTSPDPSKGGELDKGACPLVYANFPIAGSNVVEKVSLTPCPSPKERGDSPPLEGLGEVGKVYINDTQYFNNVPLSVWNFYIGGYQPAQKWLKDRKGRKLDYNDLEHYQKIIRALKETEETMKEIN